MGVSRADNSENILRNLPISNPKAEFDENPLLFTQVIIQERKYGRVSGR